MDSQTQNKKCQNCKQEFRIEPEDFNFYEKIQVPAPTWCPECRLIRRMLWRNEYIFYKRKCDAPGHEEMLISLYPPERKLKVYDQKYWWSDEWDGLAYAKGYDFSRPFLSQFQELLGVVPTPNLVNEYTTITRSDYSNWAGGVKDCYLITDADYVENSAYGSGVAKSKECIDCDTISDCELCYWGFNLRKCYRAIGCVNCHECTDAVFCKGCVGCNNCFGCISLRNKSYYFFNQPCTKEEYRKKFSEFLNGSWEGFIEGRKKAEEFWIKHPLKNLRGTHNVNSTGDYIYHTKNTKCGFLVSDVEDSKFIALLHSPGTKDCYDYTDWGENSQQLYECMTVGGNVERVKFSQLVVHGCYDIQYSYFCINSSNLFGCAGLRNKQYCIQNKQYSKEEYDALLPKIKEHMDKMPYIDKNGRVYKYGEFFPPELSPFAYNESTAQEHFPLTEESAIEKGFSWRKPDERNYQITLQPEDLPDNVRDAKEDILEQIIGCGHKGECNHQCTTAFKIIPMELIFLQYMNLPLPRLCPRCRHYERLKQRNPFKMWHRKCQCLGTQSENGAYKNTFPHYHKDAPCDKEFETTYAPGGPEIVYCEQCYQAEVV